jgi:hypothetical protein
MESDGMVHAGRAVPRGPKLAFHARGPRAADEPE